MVARNIDQALHRDRQSGEGRARDQRHGRLHKGPRLPDCVTQTPGRAWSGYGMASIGAPSGSGSGQSVSPFPCRTGYAALGPSSCSTFVWSYSTSVAYLTRLTGCPPAAVRMRPQVPRGRAWRSFILQATLPVGINEGSALCLKYLFTPGVVVR